MDKKIFLIIAVLIGLYSCENKGPVFDDFDIKACYFPYQSPARTLILGKYDQGFNDNDNNFAFEIGVTMSGVYENSEERKVHFRLAPELLDSVVNVAILPANYYTIETKSPVTIPAGSIKGRIKVQLNEQFFDDSLSFAPLDSVNYVIPLIITKVENLDTILSGKAAVAQPNLVAANDWTELPKNYTLFGIKFINKYHANYLLRGTDSKTDTLGNSSNAVYHEQFVEKDKLIMLTTTGKNSVSLSNNNGKVKMELLFNEEGNCTVQSNTGDLNNVTGTGKFVENGDAWGGKSRDVIHLQYNYTDPANKDTHTVNDTLVVRDRNVEFELFNIYVK